MTIELPSVRFKALPSSDRGIARNISPVRCDGCLNPPRFVACFASRSTPVKLSRGGLLIKVSVYHVQQHCGVSDVILVMCEKRNIRA